MKSFRFFDLAATNVFALTAVCLLALFAARRLFRHDPSLRYYVCLAGLVGVLLSPVVVSIQAQAGYSLLTLSLPEKVTSPLAYPSNVSAQVKANAGTRAGTHEILVRQSWLCWGVLATLAVWAMGVAWGIVRFVQGCKEAERLTKGVFPWKAPDQAEALNQVERLLGCPFPPVFTSPRILSPVAVGILRPLVILPQGLAETLSPTQLRQVLLHEYAHVALRHMLGGVVGRVAGLLFWPHPLVRVLCRELARAREEVCDNVASQEDGAACYARTLFIIAQGMFTAPNVASALALLDSGTSLEDRISGLLDPRRNRMVQVKRWKLWGVTGVAILATASTVVVRVVAAKAPEAQSALSSEIDAKVTTAAEVKQDKALAAQDPLTAEMDAKLDAAFEAKLDKAPQMPGEAVAFRSRGGSGVVSAKAPVAQVATRTLRANGHRSPGVVSAKAPAGQDAVASQRDAKVTTAAEVKQDKAPDMPGAGEANGLGPVSSNPAGPMGPIGPVGIPGIGGSGPTSPGGTTSPVVLDAIPDEAFDSLLGVYY